MSLARSEARVGDEAASFSDRPLRLLPSRKRRSAPPAPKIPCGASSAYDLIESSMHPKLGKDFMNALREATVEGKLDATQLVATPGPGQQSPMTSIIDQSMMRRGSGCGARAVWDAMKASHSPESFAVVAAALEHRRQEIKRRRPHLQDALILGQFMSPEYVNNEYKKADAPLMVQACAYALSANGKLTWPCFFGQVKGGGIDLKSINDDKQSSLYTAWRSYLLSKCRA